MSKMPLHWSFGHLQPKLWAKEGPGVKLTIWLPTTKSRESTSSQHSIESATRRWKDLDEGYNFGLDLVAIRLCSRELWAPKVSGLQQDSFGTISGTPTWESQEFVPFGCSLRRKLQRILYEGRWLPPSPGCGESSESKVACGLSQHPKVQNEF
jgi:hypothetical protein